MWLAQPTIAVIVSATVLAHSQDLPVGIRDVPVVNVDEAAHEITITVPATDMTASGPQSHLLVVAEPGGLGWGEFLRADQRRLTFRLGRGQPQEFTTTQPHYRAWLIPSTVTARLLPHWPPSATLFARLDSLAPGLRSVWLDVNPECDISPGETWWLRSGGRQPLARLDVRLVEGASVFCTIAPLVAGLTLDEGDRVGLWPSPADRRDGVARTAVVFVQPQGEAQLVWLAAPRGVPCPPESRVDILRRGRFIAHAVVERADDRFWYARTMTDGGDSGLPPEREPVRTGDDALVRSQRDLTEHRFAARVFEIREDGALINAGELDEIAVGQSGTAWRGGVTLGPVVIVKVQRDHAVVRRTAADQETQPPASEGAENEPALRVGDQVRFGPPPASDLPLGTIEAIADGAAFLARLEPGVRCPTGRPLLLVNEGAKPRNGESPPQRETVGVAVVVFAEHGAAVGFVLSESMTWSPGGLDLKSARAPAAGMRLLLPQPGAQP